MSDLDLQQVLSSRYRTSSEADKHIIDMQRHLGLSTKAAVARMALGRSLGMGALPDTTVDSKGLDIPASSLFSTEDIGAWVGLVVSHAFTNGTTLIDSTEAFRAAIRAHWHRGAVALWADWTNCDQNYDKFIETLVARRSDMPENGTGKGVRGDEREPGPEPGEPDDASQALTKALAELGIKVQVKEVIHGPRITRYRVLLMRLPDLAKISKSTSQLGSALNLGNVLPMVSNGDEAKTVFIDLPRAKSTWKTAEIDRLKNWAIEGPRDTNQLMVYAGVTVTGADVTFDLADAPHLLVGGTTNSGKSVCLHSILLSLLLRHKPETLQVALIDPKKVEFSAYAKLPHLYRGEIVTETPEALELLTELVVEMDARYTGFTRLGVANIAQARRKGQALPFIVVFIEEMADLVMQDANIEPLIARLAQKARAAGIHLVLATQRPDAKTFTGLIRSNIPARIALLVQKGTESTIILDEVGAENLLGTGDMLIRLPGEIVKRALGVYVRPGNIAQIVGTLSK